MLLRQKGLTKRYKDNTAVDGLELSIKEGELFALLGINGAGKTTTIRMLTCLSKPTEGTAKVYDADVIKDSDKVKKVVGISTQDTAVAGKLTVEENLRFMADIYGVDRSNVEKVIEDFSLKFMLKNHKQAKSANEQMLGTFRRQLQYKCEEFGIQLIKANQFYPSSRLCSHCGSYKSITLKERIYVCEKCGAIIDRDTNAAINLEHYGIYKHIAFTLNDSNKAM